MNPRHYIDSKTNGGLLLLLVVVIGLSIFDHLTPEAVEAIKWIGGAFMSVRFAANLPRRPTDA